MSPKSMQRNRPQNRKSTGTRDAARRRRILLLADFAYASGRGIASGIIRFLSAHSGIDLLLHGRTSEMPAMRKDLIPVYLIPERYGSDAPHHFLRLFKACTG